MDWNSRHCCQLADLGGHVARSVSSLADTARAHRALSPPPPRDFLNLKSTPPSPPEKTLTSLSSPTEQLAVCSQLCRQTHLGPRPPCSCPGWHPGVKISVPEKEQAGGECFLGAEGKVTRGGRLARRGPQGGTWKPGEGPLAPTPCPPHACWAEGLGRAGPSPSLPGDSHAHARTAVASCGSWGSSLLPGFSLRLGGKSDKALSWVVARRFLNGSPTPRLTASGA